MLSHGDELGRSLLGNSNAYCHDSELNWLDWKLTPSDQEFFEFTCEVLRVSREYRALHSRQRSARTLLPESLPSDGLVWFGADGREMTREESSESDLSAFAVLMRAASPVVDPVDAFGKPLLLLVSADVVSREFILPQLLPPGDWEPLVSTAHPGKPQPVSDRVELAPKSLVLLRLV
jgi:glycogen operon protein